MTSSADKLSRRYDHSRGGDNFHGGSDGGKYGKESKYDDPPHSRLFIVCGKSITEEDFRESFSKHGTIEEIWVVKDRNTEEPKGKYNNNSNNNKTTLCVCVCLFVRG